MSSVKEIEYPFIIDLQERAEDIYMLSFLFFFSSNFFKQIDDSSLSYTNLIWILINNRLIGGSLI